MPGTFQRSWRFLGEEVFVPLASLERDPPPADMFAELGKLFLSHFGNVHQKVIIQAQSKWAGANERAQKAGQRLIEIYAADWEDIERALAGIQEYEQQGQALDKLKGVWLPHLAEENDVIDFLEKSNELLKEYKQGWARSYQNFLSRFVWKYGLGYEIRHNPFEIRPLIHNEFARLYDRLRNFKGASGDLQDLLGDFEHSYALFVLGQQPEDLNNALMRAFSYLEGLAGEKLGRRGTSLGALATQCERKGLFPHKGSLAGSLSKLYGFPSDYPRLRHPGTPASKIRELIPQDCIYLSLMALLWAGYINGLPIDLSEQDNQEQEQAA